MCCPELEVFKPYFSKLVESIPHPEQLAIQLYSQDMISKAVRDEAMHIKGSPAPYRASKLVAAVEDQIMVNPPVLHKFLSVVRGDPSLVYIADAMCDSYRECIISSVYCCGYLRYCTFHLRYYTLYLRYCTLHLRYCTVALRWIYST